MEAAAHIGKQCVCSFTAFAHEFAEEMYLSSVCVVCVCADLFARMCVNCRYKDASGAEQERVATALREFYDKEHKVRASEVGREEEGRTEGGHGGEK